MRVELRPEFRAAFPEGIFGVLIARGCANRPDSTRLGPAQRAVEGRLRQRFPGDAIDVDPVAVAYRGYFRRFGNRYPVVHQAKAILTGRPIESPSALVEAMFTAEVDTLVLTSGHDLDALAEPLHVDIARDGDLYTKISGKEERLRSGDMIVRDAEGIIASVLYGPDSRTRLRAASTAALFGAWCPVGLAADVAERHLDALAALLRLEWPEAMIDAPRIYRSGGT